MTSRTGTLGIMIIFVFLFPILVIANSNDRFATVNEAESAQEISRNGITDDRLIIRQQISMAERVAGHLKNLTATMAGTMPEWAQLPSSSSFLYLSNQYAELKQPQLTPENVATDEESNNTIPPKIVVLDPGHGGIDPGAVVSEDIFEKDIVYEYARMAEENLAQSGYTVYMTRGADSSCTTKYTYKKELACRSAFADTVNGDIFISIHADANPLESYRGTVTFYNARNDLDGKRNPYPEQSKALAEWVHQYVQPAMESVDLGVQNKNYYVNRINTVPSVLIELGVMTNSDDLELLISTSKPARFAEALTRAVDQYFAQFTASRSIVRIDR